MSEQSQAVTPPPRTERTPLGRVEVPVRFGDQVVTSMLFNHDANPVHHKPDHAVQWMLGLLSSTVFAGDGALAQASAEERTYTMGSSLLGRQDIVVMPGAVMAAIAYERFVPPEEVIVSITTTFTYPLLVPTKGEVLVRLDGFELRSDPTAGAAEKGLGNARHLLIEAHGPGLDGLPVRLVKLEAVLYPAGVAPEAVYEKIVAREFESLSKLSSAKQDMPSLSHSSAISEEDRRRYARILGIERGITCTAWQAKIPRVMTEIIDHLRSHTGYQKEVRAYYDGRADEAERREAIAKYVQKEIKYRAIREQDAEARVNELAELTQQLYARQHTVFDPRLFVPGGPATKGSTPFILDLHLSEMRLRRGIHRFYTGARLQDRQVFMGEAMVTGQPLVTKELANFLCEINHSFATLKLFEYQRRG
ncbi:MAG: hypothetical protein HY291_03425 [Planctomycetes bacterium]|nr:hypothetical protein [Planctomycetota bacterium]